MSLAERTAVHRCQVPFPAGAASSPALALALAVTARKARASMARVACRYQARYLRTWQWPSPASPFAPARQSSIPHLASATAVSSGR